MRECFTGARQVRFLAREPVFAPHSKSVLIPHYRVQDIDEPDDWLRAELMYQLLEQQALL